MKCLRMNPARSCLVLMAVTTPAYGQEAKPPAQGIDTVTVAAYEKLGAAHGTMVKVYGAKTIYYSDYFLQSREHAGKGVPGFLFRSMPKAEFPQVGVPFGLVLRGKS